MKKVIVIASGVASIIFTLVIIGSVTWANIKKGHLVVMPDFVVLTPSLCTILISSLVLYNIKLNRPLKILTQIISVLIVLGGVIVFIDFLKLIKDSELLFLFIIYCLGFTAVVITMLTYIRRALWPAETKETKIGMNRTILIVIGILCAVITAAGIMWYHPAYVAPIPDNPIREVQYEAGADNIWFTSDDIIYGYYSYTYNDQGKETRWIRCYDAGPDGIWFTEDDVIKDYDSYTYDDRGQKTRDIEYNDSGADGVWFTEDDVIKDYDSYTYDDRGEKTLWVDYIGAGADSIWFTADDVIRGYGSYIYNDQGKLTQIVWYKSGADSVWFTKDDVANAYDSRTYDAQGKRTISTWFRGAGIDSVWLTINYDSHIYDAQGKEIRWIIYSATGADGVWFTEDDKIYDYYTYNYGTQGEKTGEICYDGAGPDGLWLTEDDVVRSYDIYIYN